MEEIIKYFSDEELSVFYGEQVYTPKCFFIENKYNTWITVLYN